MSKKSVRLTKAEFQVMKYFWSDGERSIREIQERMAEEADLAYTTVQTLVGRLEAKGALRRTRKIGNAFLFEAVITEDSTYRRLVDELLDLFGGSAEPLMAHLFESGKVTLKDLERLEKASRAAGSDPAKGRKRS
jgi:BlaI family transcriptional regulator, penicillinase repressor